jgi:DNA-binding NtrC family response regulator
VSGATTPLEPKGAGLPVRTLRVDVVEGPDAGKSCVAGSESVTVGTAEGNELVLTDPTVSRYHLELIRHPKGVLVLDHRSTNGTLAGPTRLERGMVPPGTNLRIGRTVVRVDDGENVTIELHPSDTLGSLRGRSRVMRRMMAQVARCAQTEAPILLVGESGTGKELIARALHDLGPRADAPFEVVDCASLAPNLVASELFGHERGAFTGAERQHVGAFERANGGTLFLDEIGELPADLQPMLLGALERRRFRRVGGRTEIAVDVRVISATHRDLRAEINANTFRLDLYYRLAVIVIRVPPLRDRPEDLPLLIESFLSEMGHTDPPEQLFPPAKMEALAAHRWPGNVRELRNLVEATVAMGEAPPLEGDIDVGETSEGPHDESQIAVGRMLRLPYKAARQELLREFELRYVKRLLETNDGNVSRAARAAGMDRSYLSGLVKRHGLKGGG